ncbi:MAG: helix-turn-helix transcriptional regulator [Candidatus Azobacteroides sp.]|nr:helix-turn-helix transcriptional regulator [Candidatus Azobacteroides sp.]
MSITKDFFKPLNPDMGINKEAYQKLEVCISMIDALARSSNQSIYIIDYNRRNFLYVSSNPLFLCGYSPGEVQQMGYAFYELVVPDEELTMLMEINKAGFEFYYRHLPEERLAMTIRYDFHLQYPDNKKILINHTLTPVLLSEQGDIWLALCMVSLSPRTTIGNVELSVKGSATRYIYSFKGKRWQEEKSISLNDREKDILRFAAQGYKMAEIAERLFIDVNTVKFHRKNLFIKLEAKNITEAIGIAANMQLI